jgi:hypothetical protein
MSASYHSQPESHRSTSQLYQSSLPHCSTRTASPDGSPQAAIQFAERSCLAHFSPVPVQLPVQPRAWSMHPFVLAHPAPEETWISLKNQIRTIVRTQNPSPKRGSWCVPTHLARRPANGPLRNSDPLAAAEQNWSPGRKKSDRIVDRVVAYSSRSGEVHASPLRSPSQYDPSARSDQEWPV